jgi:hypothetical protein
MPETLHRKDISAIEFKILAMFCAALNRLQEDDLELLWYLGEVKMFLPVWAKAGGEWRLSRYKEFTKESIGIQTADFRRICRYMAVKEHVVIRVLFRLSMLAVAGRHSVLDRPRFRQGFFGVPYSDVAGEPCFYTGFTLEMRRCEGFFRGFCDDEAWYSEDIHHYSEQFSSDRC